MDMNKGDRITGGSGDCCCERNSQTHRRVRWKDPQGPRMYTNPWTQELAPEGPDLLMASGGSD